MPKILGGYAAKQCAYRTHNDVATDPELALPPDAAARQRMDQGIEFEDVIGAQLAALHGGTGVFLPPDRLDDDGRRLDEDKSAREQATVDAMRDGAPFIWNARLPVDTIGRRVAEPDFLVRLGRGPGNVWQYAPGDVKHHMELAGTRAPREWRVSTLREPHPMDGLLKETHGNPHLVDVMQLAHYYRVLETLGHQQTGEGPIWGAVIGKSCEILWVDMREPFFLAFDEDEGKRTRQSALLDLYDDAFELRLAVADRAEECLADDTVEPLVGPLWKSECANCPWQQVCHDQLTEADHISLLQALTPAKARMFTAAGITTRAQLAKLDRRTAILADTPELDLPAWIAEARAGDPGTPADVLVDGRKKREKREALAAAGVYTFADLASLDDRTAALSHVRQSSLTLQRLIDIARVWMAARVHLAPGVDRLDIPRGDIEVDIDMENAPGVGDELIYMWGTTTTVRPGVALQLGKRTNAYHADHAINYLADPNFDSAAAEANAFAGLWRWIQALQLLTESTGHTLRLYCYSPAEERCMRALVRKHAGRPGIPTMADLDDLFASDMWVDLLKIFKEQTIWPTENMSIKSLAKYARFAWRDSDASGGNSIVWYSDAINSATQEERTAAFERVLAYNEDDTTAMLHLRQWFERLNSARDRSSKVPNVTTLERRFKPRRRRAAAAAA